MNDEEERRHAAIFRGRPLHGENRGQNRGDDQAAEFKRAMRLRPAAEPQQHDSASRDRREDEQAGVPREHSHSIDVCAHVWLAI